MLGRRRAGHGHLPIWILGMYSLLVLQLKFRSLSGDLGCIDPSIFSLVVRLGLDEQAPAAWIILLPGQQASWVRRLAGRPVIWPSSLWQQLGHAEATHEKRLFLVSYSGCKRKPAAAAAMAHACQAAAAMQLFPVASCFFQRHPSSIDHPS